MTEELDVSTWSAEDQKAHGVMLAALVGVADNALPANLPVLTLIQIGLLAPNLGDFVGVVGNLLAHAVEAQERAKAAPSPDADLTFAARNIVSQILDESGADVATRQRINDKCDAFTMRVLREFRARRARTCECVACPGECHGRIGNPAHDGYCCEPCRRSAGAAHTVECTWDMDDGCRQKTLEQWMYVEPSAYSYIVIPRDVDDHA